MIRLQHKLHYISWQQIIHVEHRLHEYLYPSKSFDQKFLLFWDTQKNLNIKHNWRKPGLLSCISQKLLIFNGLFRSALIKAADTVSLRVYKCSREPAQGEPVLGTSDLLLTTSCSPSCEDPEAAAPPRTVVWLADGQSEPAALRVSANTLQCHLHMWPCPCRVLEGLDLLLSPLVGTAPVFLPQHSPLQWLSPTGVFQHRVCRVSRGQDHWGAGWQMQELGKIRSQRTNSCVWIHLC